MQENKKYTPHVASQAFYKEETMYQLEYASVQEQCQRKLAANCAQSRSMVQSDGVPYAKDWGMLALKHQIIERCLL